MAILKKGILGGFSGGIADINGYSNYSKECIRSNAVNRKDANTQVQLDNRIVFKKVNEFLNTIYEPLIRITLSKTHDVITPYFLFNKLNYGAFDEFGLKSPGDLVISKGILLGTSNFALDFVGGTGNAQFSWTNNADGIVGYNSDRFYGFVYNVTLRSIQLFETHPLRFDGIIVQQFPAGWLLTHSFAIYTCFVQYNGLDVSNTSYLAL